MNALKQQQKVNSDFIKACKADNVELVRYLLTSKEIPINAQLSTSKTNGESKEGEGKTFPLRQAVKHNSKKVYKYFIEEMNMFATLPLDAKVSILAQSAYSDDVETASYIFKKIEDTSKLKDYQKPFLLDPVLTEIINQGAKILFDYMVSLPKIYQGIMARRSNNIIRIAAEKRPDMLEYMLSQKEYEDLSTISYINLFRGARNNSISSLILFKHGVKQGWINETLNGSNNDYIQELVIYCVFKTTEDTVLKYIHNQQIKNNSCENFESLVNKNLKNYLYSDEGVALNSNRAPVFEYILENNLLTKTSKEELLLTIIRQDYKTLLKIVGQYPKYGEGTDLSECFYEAMDTKRDVQSMLSDYIDLLKIDVDKTLPLWDRDFQFFKDMESAKTKLFQTNYDDIVKQVFLEYEFTPNENLEKIYEKNPELLSITRMKSLGEKLNKQTKETPEEKAEQLKRKKI